MSFSQSRQAIVEATVLAPVGFVVLLLTQRNLVAAGIAAAFCWVLVYVGQRFMESRGHSPQPLFARRGRRPTPKSEHPHYS
jgi:hypothetical protein